MKDNATEQYSQPLSEPAHALEREAVVTQLKADPRQGLSSAEAKSRLEQYGKNELDDGPGVQPFKILLRQVANAMMLVLIMAMVVSFAIKSWIEGGVVCGVIILNIVVGFFQEFNAEKTMDSLRSLSSPTANVVRNGETVNIPTAELVPGDLVELKLGDTVPADIRLLESLNFEVDEALLTGESLPVAKDEEAIFDAETGPGDRLNVAYSSSTVTKGRARGVVYATGMHTEIGAIAAALRKGSSKVRPVKHRPDGSVNPFRYAESWSLTFADAVGRFLGVNVGTPLQRKLSRLAILLFGIAIVCAIIVEAANNFSSNNEVIIYAVATGLSMIPASLIVVLTITMAVGTKRMVKRNVIVRKMDALEALGGVTDICSDKTGTLTQGKMVARKCWIPARGVYSIGTSNEPFNPTVGDLVHTPKAPEHHDSSEEDGTPLAYDDAVAENPHLTSFLWIASLANLAHVYKSKEDVWLARGDPTEIALQVFASRFDFNRHKFLEGPNPRFKQVSEYPFDSTVKRMSVIFEDTESGEQWVYTKGAVERILDSCVSVHWSPDDESEVELDDHKKQVILARMEALASEGLRVLALASRYYDPRSGRRASRDGPPPREHVETGLVFRGLIGLYDPPRPESADAVKHCHRAGIKVHMLTGDHPGTARAIAIQVGILPDMNKVSAPVAQAMVMTAAEFDRHTDEQLDQLPELPLVIARCAPNTKVRMIEALRRRKAFMAMTGDGVNDSPSLKIADVGIAMGQAGSDVAKDASDIVLTDDNFASILNAIEEGRRMFDNIKKFVLHLLAENIAQACTLLIGLAFKDSTNLSVFPLAPVEILWVIMITSGMPDMGLGMEVAAPDILERPPQNLERGVFTLEVMLDMLVYGLWMSALCLSSFLLVVYGFGDGNLGSGCNDSYSAQCDTVFRARATTFVSLTWFALFLAWEMVDMRRSFFRMQPGSKRYFTQWMYDVWRNKFLCWSIIAGFVTIFPTLYIPVLNHDVFKHTGISWEWGIVFVEAFLFFLGAEAWKWAKRVYLRRRARRMHETPDDLERRAFGTFLTLDSNESWSGSERVQEKGEVGKSG
ncbi:P-type ATPase [Exophiala dermatitidis]|uniref:P-type Na(+) transporter n=3 Tax=Exophiala dermatitidis TaxID=5970 RepID=H6CAP4_EXODN|nr:potassium/sodium efflux P-type ATPase, fungal-type [Exophiala dermatitidis NIH/UT8656]KAJ4527857.1 P-type ATPase [Exophiala dermatitidis]EHY60841.1 potassium/sodium efflux P-type ATPase, fungal-type [Exophiala dermatitidis NIH/UT8656]KAJ4528491.1 P-type ATPase [Exophiala dermatitidis]KAJ4529860.1 P-type ATPase [Exophiala dermatitidis]KAJ4558618.1 P-type ATPase [Exophiala dermatitidis]